MENPAKGYSAWQSSYPVDGLFLEEQIGHALDNALTDNPDLIEDYTCIYLVVMDRPNLFMPAYLGNAATLPKVASRYLRIREGDGLKLDSTTEDQLICYTLPRQAVEMIQSYYNRFDSIHLVSILWKEIQKQAQQDQDGSQQVFFTILRNHLLVLAEHKGKLVFSRHFDIRDNSDVFYFTTACMKLFRTGAFRRVVIDGELSSFDFPVHPQLQFADTLRFPSIPAMLMHHFPCAS